MLIGHLRDRAPVNDKESRGEHQSHRDFVKDTINTVAFFSLNELETEANAVKKELKEVEKVSKLTNNSIHLFQQRFELRADFN